MIDPDSVFQNLETQRASGALARSVTSSKFRYQSSHEGPELLERVERDGTIATGRFVDGVFLVQE